MNVNFPVDEHGSKFNKAFYNRLFQIIKMCAETGSFIRNRKTGYIAITVTWFPISRLCRHYQMKLHVTGNTQIMRHPVCTAMLKCGYQNFKRDFIVRSIDNFSQSHINDKNEHWHGVLKLIIACIQYLAEHVYAF